MWPPSALIGTSSVVTFVAPLLRLFIAIETSEGLMELATPPTVAEPGRLQSNSSPGSTPSSKSTLSTPGFAFINFWEYPDYETSVS